MWDFWDVRLGLGMVLTVVYIMVVGPSYDAFPANPSTAFLTLPLRGLISADNAFADTITSAFTVGGAVLVDFTVAVHAETKPSPSVFLFILGLHYRLPRPPVIPPHPSPTHIPA